MKAVIICPRTPRENFGGLENYTLRLAERVVAESGNEVEIFTTSPRPREYMHGKVKVREFPVFAPNESYYFSLEAFNALRGSDADVIHSVGYNNLLTYAALLAKKQSQKFVVSINLSGEPPLLRKILNFFYDVAVNFFAGRIDAVICVGEYELGNFFKRLNVPREKFSVIPMGIDIGQIRAVKPGKKQRYILSAGRFVKVKEFHNLIPAFALLLKEVPDVRLVLMGSGPLEGELRRIAKKEGVGEMVVFEKPVPLERVSELHKKMKESQMFVNLVDCGYEGIISIEAIACEVPVLLCDSKGALEFVKKGYAQAIKDPNNHKQVKEKMLEMLKNPEKYTPKNPRIYSWDEVTQKSYDVYKEVLKRK